MRLANTTCQRYCILAAILLAVLHVGSAHDDTSLPINPALGVPGFPDCVRASPHRPLDVQAAADDLVCHQVGATTEAIKIGCVGDRCTECGTMPLTLPSPTASCHCLSSLSHSAATPPELWVLVAVLQLAFIQVVVCTLIQRSCSYSSINTKVPANMQLRIWEHVGRCC